MPKNALKGGKVSHTVACRLKEVRFFCTFGPFAFSWSYDKIDPLKYYA